MNDQQIQDAMVTAVIEKDLATFIKLTKLITYNNTKEEKLC